MDVIFANPKLMKMLNSDLQLLKFGKECCLPGHFNGPTALNFFSIHYVWDGMGIFQINNNIYTVKKGQGFLIFPNELTFYQSDLINPWSYSWIAFNGPKAKLYLKYANLSHTNPIFSYTKDNALKECIDKMFVTSRESKIMEFNLMIHLYNFFSLLIENNGEDPLFFKNRHDSQLKNTSEIYVKKAIGYIERNYANSISISDIAKRIGLEPSYFGYIFKKHTHTSPQNYLINFRIKEALRLMQNPLLSISNIARSVGYKEYVSFNRAFKKVKGCSPREYRKCNTRSSILNKK